MKMRKSITALVLCLMMLVSVFPAATFAAQDDDIVLLNETFDGDKFTADGKWAQNGAGFKDGTLVVNRGNWPILKLGSVTEIDPNKTYEFSYKVKFTSADCPEGYSPTWRCYDYNTNGMCYGGAQIGVGFAFDTGIPGQKEFKDAFKNANPGTWYTVKTAFKTSASSRYVCYTLLGEDGNVIATDEDNKIYKGQSGEAVFGADEEIINEVCFWNEGYTDPVCVDDVTLKQLAEKSDEDEEGVLLNENFDSENISDLTSGAWYRPGGNITFKNGAMGFAPGSYIYFNINDKDTSTTYEVTYDIMSEKSGNGGGGLNFYSGDDNPFCLGMFNSAVGLACEKEVKEAAYVISGTKADKWYTVSVRFNDSDDNKFITYTLTDKESGKVLGTHTPEKFEKQNASVEVSGNHTSYAIWNRDDNGASDETYFIDNLSFKVAKDQSKPESNPVNPPVGPENPVNPPVGPEEPVEPEDPTVGEVVFRENFDNSTIADLYARGWARASSGVKFEDNALKMEPNQYIAFYVYNRNVKNVYRFSYDVKAKAAGNSKGGLNVYAQGKFIWSAGMFNSTNGLGCLKMDHGDSSRVIKGTEAGKWYTVVVDFCENGENSSISYTLIDKESGEELGSREYAPIEAMTGGGSLTEPVSEFWIWNREGSDEVFLVDNVKFENLGAKPTFSEKSVYVKDMIGNKVADLTAPVTPGVSSIELDFGASMNEDSLKEGVTFAERTASGDDVAVELDAKLSGNKYILTPKDMLKENTKYVLKVSKTVKGTGGANLPKTYAVEFTTGSYEVGVESDGVYDGANKVDAITSFVANKSYTVKGKVMNTTEDTADLVVCVSYFKGGKMVKTEVFVSKIQPKSGDTIEQTFTVPAGVADCDSAQVVFWNGADKLNPYCKAITLKK